MALHGNRTYGQNGPNAISYCEIDAYSRVTCANLSPWEVDVIQKLDLSFRLKKFNSTPVAETDGTVIDAFRGLAKIRNKKQDG